MKKTLLLQTALVAAAGLFVADIASAQVKAEPLSVTLGGTHNQFFKVQDKGDAQNGQHADGLGFNSDIHFKIRSVLTDGTVIGAFSSLETMTHVDQIDESFIFVENTGIGRIELGSTDRVHGKMLYFAPNAIPSHGTTVNGEGPATNPLGAPLMWFGNANHDTQGINAYTASNRYFGSKVGKGLQLGVSYVPDGCQDLSGNGTCGGGFGSTNNSGQLSSQYAAAANYLESFGAFDGALYAGYNSVNIEATTADAAGSGSAEGRVSGWQVGTQWTYNVGDGSAVQFGGGYSDEGLTKGNATVAKRDRKAYSVGLKYLTNGANAGSVGIGVEYYKRTDTNTQNGVAGAANRGDQELQYYTLGLTYQVAPGVLTFAGIGVSDLDQPGNITATAAGTTGADNKQTFGLVGIGLTF